MVGRIRAKARANYLRAVMSLRIRGILIPSSIELYSTLKRTDENQNEHCYRPRKSICDILGVRYYWTMINFINYM